jgi:hypothetical protein
MNVGMRHPFRYITMPCSLNTEIKVLISFAYEIEYFSNIAQLLPAE